MGGAMAIASPALIVGTVAAGGYLGYKAWNNEQPKMTNKINNNQLNVLNKPLELCSLKPLTGFYRDGYAKTGPDDTGSHVVCAELTDEFLEYSKSMGNDLMTPHP